MTIRVTSRPGLRESVGPRLTLLGPRNHRARKYPPKRVLSENKCGNHLLSPCDYHRPCGLHFRVRNGNGCFPARIVTATVVLSPYSPSSRALFLGNSQEGRAKEDLHILQNLMKKVLANKPDYQCTSCGFSGKSLHWQCPGCRQWSTMQPIYSLEEGLA